jgi:excisionase family DNA binding protein
VCRALCLLPDSHICKYISVVSGSQYAIKDGDGMTLNNIELLTVNETAVELNLSPGTIRAWLLSRKLAAVRLGRAVRIPRSELERLIGEGTTPAKGNRR